MINNLLVFLAWASNKVFETFVFFEKIHYWKILRVLENLWTTEYSRQRFLLNRFKLSSVQWNLLSIFSVMSAILLAIAFMKEAYYTTLSHHSASQINIQKHSNYPTVNFFPLYRTIRSTRGFWSLLSLRHAFLVNFFWLLSHHKFFRCICKWS